MNPTNKPVSINLNGKSYKLLFDMNTFVAFEEVSGKFFFDFLQSVQEALAFAKGNNDPSSLLRRISLKEDRKSVV